MFKRLLKLIISIVFFVIDYLRNIIRHLFRKIDPGTCVVLLYHVVTPERRKTFARQMDDLIKLAKPISIFENRVLEPGRHHVAITFDDGYYSFIENALPELTQRKIPVAIFVPAGRLGQKPDWLTSNYSHFGNEIVMTSDNLRKLIDNHLVTVGSHGLTHNNFIHLEEKEILKELIESKYTLENILQRNIDLLSFPYGSYTQRHLEYSRSAGYKHTFGILPTMAFCDHDEYVSGRVDVEPDDFPLEFRLKTLGAYRWLPIAFSIKRYILSTLRLK
jgi:peptidoglycan/xylan/chitin deacetylase (PgdA/CDA1 family)